MNLCGICGMKRPDLAETCPNDGEASWVWITDEDVTRAPDEPQRTPLVERREQKPVFREKRK